MRAPPDVHPVPYARTLADLGAGIDDCAWMDLSRSHQ